MHKSKDVLKTLSKIASEAYLKNKGSLKDELVKIAKQESVSPVQIDVLVADANQQVWKSLYDLDKKASYGFQPVDPKSVVNALQKEEASMAKVASTDYLSGPETGQKDFSFGLHIQTYGMDKVATDRRELRQTLQNRLEKMAQARELLMEKEIAAESGVEALEAQIVKQAKQMLLEVPFLERSAGFDKIAEVVRAVMVPKKSKEAARLIVKISNTLKTAGMVKESDLKAPEEYISKKLPARIINGRHPLYITIGTLGERWNELEQIRRGREIVDSSLPELKEKVRGL